MGEAVWFLHHLLEAGYSISFLTLVTLFVHQYDTADTALARVSSPEECLGMLLAAREGLQSSSRCPTRGRGLRAATNLTAHPAASLGPALCPEQLSSTVVQHGTETQERDDRSAQRRTSGQTIRSIVALVVVRAVKCPLPEIRSNSNKPS